MCPVLPDAVAGYALDMARAVWSGTISFGLVNVPVKAFTAVRDHKVHFRELDPKGGRVRHEKVSAKTGKPVDEVKLGFETSKGHYVRFTPKEIDELRPTSTRAIDVSDFVDLGARRKEMALARQIIDALASEWEPERYHDTYTEELRRLIKRRATGGKTVEVEDEAPPEEGAEVVDLMAALEASVTRARKGRRSA